MSLGIQLMCRGKSHKRRIHTIRKELRGQKRELRGKP
jgi:hypothetical protein